MTQEHLLARLRAGEDTLTELKTTPPAYSSVTLTRQQVLDGDLLRLAQEFYAAYCVERDTR